MLAVRNAVSTPQASPLRWKSASLQGSEATKVLLQYEDAGLTAPYSDCRVAATRYGILARLRSSTLKLSTPTPTPEISRDLPVATAC